MAQRACTYMFLFAALAHHIRAYVACLAPGVLYGCLMIVLQWLKACFVYDVSSCV